MQFAALRPPAAAALFAANNVGSETPSPVSAPICKKLRRLTPSQSVDRPVVNRSTAETPVGVKGGLFQAGTRCFEATGVASSSLPILSQPNARQNRNVGRASGRPSHNPAQS